MKKLFLITFIVSSLFSQVQAEDDQLYNSAVIKLIKVTNELKQDLKDTKRELFVLKQQKSAKTTQTIDTNKEFENKTLEEKNHIAFIEGYLSMNKRL